MKKHIFDLFAGVRNRHILMVDLAAFLVIPWFALFLRVDDIASIEIYLSATLIYTVLSIVWKLSVFVPFGMYARYWRYASVDELASILYASMLSWTIGIILFFAVLKPEGLLPQFYPRSIPISDGLLTLAFVGGIRFLLRLGVGYKESAGTPARNKKRALIVGAGVAGSMIVKELHMNPSVLITPVGFLDDDPRKHRAMIHGVQVLGKLADLKAVAGDCQAQEVIIAMPTASGGTIREVVQQCKEAGIPSKTIPGIFEILSGSAHVSQIREVQIEDLLRRGVVQTDTDGVGNLLQNARVMVTGAGGSIGSELCRQIAGFGPESVIMVGHGENSVFDIAKELREGLGAKGTGAFPHVRVHTVIADVRDRERLRQIFQLFRPEIVFHAAAHKHVGLMEENVSEAVTNNVLGTRNLAELSDHFGVERFVMISSDKAVNPTSVMGVTKRIAELVVQDIAQRTGKPFVSVRFGNVLGSRGSVVPIFKQQIEQGGPVCVTDPETSRFFMTIPEAVQLVLQAATMGEGSEVFVLDMGEPIKIVDLAKDLIRLSGFKEGEEIKIVFTGLKHGEKMYEELFYQNEACERSQHEKILVCRNGGIHMAGGEELRANIERLVAAAHQGASRNVKVLLKSIVPEYREKVDLPAVPVLPIARTSGGIPVAEAR